MKKVIPFFIVVSSILFIGLSLINYYTYFDKSDSINDADEKLIKKFSANHEYTFDELKELQIEYLGEVSLNDVGPQYPSDNYYRYIR